MTGSQFPLEEEQDLFELRRDLIVGIPLPEAEAPIESLRCRLKNAGVKPHRVIVVSSRLGDRCLAERNGNTMTASDGRDESLFISAMSGACS